jgi:hypothetical protein
MMKLQKPFHNVWCQILKWTAEHDCWKWRDPKHIGELASLVHLHQ